MGTDVWIEMKGSRIRGKHETQGRAAGRCSLEWVVGEAEQHC